MPPRACSGPGRRSARPRYCSPVPRRRALAVSKIQIAMRPSPAAQSDRTVPGCNGFPLQLDYSIERGTSQPFSGGLVPFSLLVFAASAFCVQRFRASDPQQHSRRAITPGSGTANAFPGPGRSGRAPSPSHHKQKATCKDQDAAEDREEPCAGAARVRESNTFVICNLKLINITNLADSLSRLG